jgi:hypothetical protein
MFSIKSVFYGKAIKIENQLKKFYSFVQIDMLLTVHSTARHNIHLQFDISVNGLEIRAV